MYVFKGDKKERKKKKKEKKYKLGKTNFYKINIWPGSISCAIRGTPWSTNSQS